MNPVLVLVTASGVEEARRIATALLDARLAACVNIIPGIESHYWWRGRREEAVEALLLVKSSAEHFAAVSDVVRANHSYECPEIVSMKPADITPAFRTWWEGGMRPAEG